MKKLILLAAMLSAVAVARPAKDVPIPADPKLTPAATTELRKPSNSVLFWPQAKRDAGFRAMETIFPGHVVKSGPLVTVMEQGTPLKVDSAVVDAYMTQWNTAGLIVLKDGKIVLERYGLGLKPEDRWTSFSVAKSFTSTLVGAAIQDGYIKSLDDPVTRYIPELAGSGYDGVTVRQLLTMTSGVKWNEDYTDPNSDVAKMLAVETKPGEDPTVAYMRTLPRDTAPGTKWVYKTGETNLIGVLVHRATGRVLSNYLSEKVFQPIGTQRDAFWMTDQTGQEISGCCLSMTLRDYALFGDFTLAGERAPLSNRRRIVPEGWFADATKPHAQTGTPGFGYGYQWWTYPGGLYGAQGIFGQSITIDPAKKVVIAMVSSWPKASNREQSMARMAFVQQLLGAVE